MKKKLIFALLFLACSLALPGSSFAQNFTTVSGTVLDPNGISYAGGTVSAVLIPNTSGNYTLGGFPISGQMAPTNLDSTGSFSVSLGSNAVILPASSQWQFTICAPARIPAPLGTGGLCFTTTGITVSGSTLNITASLGIAATALATTWNPSRIFNTISGSVNTSISAVTMATAPGTPIAGTRYNFSTYVTQTVLGASCAGNSTIVVNAIFQDQFAAAPQTIPIATYTITTNGTLGNVPLTANAYAGSISLLAKLGTVIQYSTTFTPGGSCSPAPSYTIYPVLELQ